jgi:hypothetical protein
MLVPRSTLHAPVSRSTKQLDYHEAIRLSRESVRTVMADACMDDAMMGVIDALFAMADG